MTWREAPCHPERSEGSLGFWQQKGRSIERPFALAHQEVGPNYFTLVTFSAAGPFAPCTMSNSTRSPSERLRKPSALMAVWWTKQSLSPFSVVIKPNPFAFLNPFSLPMVRAIAPSPVYLTTPAPECPERGVFMIAGLSRVIKNERPEGDSPGS